VLVYLEPLVSSLDNNHLDCRLNISILIADQIYGDEEMHSIARNHCMDHIVRALSRKFIFFFYKS
jgi:hypothetical protein